ncbi:MAG: hypothetical protein IJ794_11165 [Lachnospiraceae bacterium]|nr:hypothetical protein [Lachnospiraceae bacterium]
MTGIEQKGSVSRREALSQQVVRERGKSRMKTVTEALPVRCDQVNLKENCFL